MMDRQNEHKLTGQPDFGRDMQAVPHHWGGGGHTASEQPHRV